MSATEEESAWRAEPRQKAKPPSVSSIWYKTAHEPFVHEWEIDAGENIPRRMDEEIKAAATQD